MPAVNPGSKVLVTGASGFIAAWVVKTLLERGFYVRGTVRSAAKGEYLVNLFKEHRDCFEYVIVEDIAKDGAFDEAVKGMDAVEHIASPCHMKADDPDEIIVPAVKGTSGILESIKKHGCSAFKRVVITSSLAAVVQLPSEGHQQTVTENDWNNLCLHQVNSKGRDASPPDKYYASKMLAERAAWEFIEKNKSDIKWDITTFTPPLVWGPTIHEIPTASSINASLIEFYAVIKGQNTSSSPPIGNWVDVRDLSVAQVNALTTEEAGGQRFLVGSDVSTYQDVLDEIHAGSASDPLLSAIPVRTSGAGKSVAYPFVIETTKSRTVLGLNFRTLSETAKDTARSFLEREKSCGW